METEETINFIIRQTERILFLMGSRLVHSLEKVRDLADGTSLLEGKVQIVKNDDGIVLHDIPFKCGAANYLFLLKNLSPDICFRSCASGYILNMIREV